MRARQNPPPPSPTEKAAIIRRAHDEAKAARAQSPHLSHAALFGEAMRRLYRAYAEGWLTEHCGATPADLAQLRAVSDGSYGYLQGKFRAAQRGRPDHLEARIDAAAGRLSADPEVQAVIRCGFPQPPRGQGRMRPAPIPVVEAPVEPARIYLGDPTGKPREQVLAEAMLKGDFSRRFERDEINDIASEMERIAPQQGKPSRVFKQFGQPVSRKVTEVWSAYRMVLEQIWANDGVNGSWAKPTSWKYRSPKGVFEFAERLPVADQEREGLVLIPTPEQISIIIGATKDHFLDSDWRPILDKYREMATTDYIRAFHSVRESVQTYVERTFGDLDEAILHPRIKPLVESLLDWDSVKTDKLRLSRKWTKEHTSYTKAHTPYTPLDETVAQLMDSVSSVVGAVGMDPSAALVYINEFKSDIKNQIDEAVKLAGPYRYGLLVRPVASYTVPSGFSEFGSDPSFKYGTVTYATKLPIKDQSHFDLMLIPTQAQRQIIEADLLSFMLFEHYRRLANYRETISEDVDFYLKAFEGMLEDIARERWGAINHVDARDIYKKVANTLLRG